jgi:HK97 family phage prohead protease
MKKPLLRSLADLEIRSDGRTVEGRLVPYGQIAEVFDHEGVPYRETFVRGAFAGACKVPEKIDLRYTHSPALDNVLARGVALEEREDGLYGQFYLYESVATRAREVLAGHAKHLSVGFFPIASRRRGGVVERVKAFLEHVAATPTPAYEGAGVLAIREEEIGEEVPVEAPSLEEVQAWLQEHRTIPRSTERHQQETVPALNDVQEYLRKTIRKY